MVTVTIISPQTDVCSTILGEPASLKQGLANDNLEARSSPLTVFVNKVLLEHGPSPLLRCGLWLLPCCNGRVESFQQRSCVPQSLRHFLSDRLQKMLIPALE